jgi:HAD superfamily hydrolase (TIGR01509 family)
MTLDAVLWDLDAVMWDMDGTLVDTEPVWWRAEIEIITGLGGRWTVEDCKTLIGSVVRGRKAGVEFQPGALELLGALNGAGIPCALVSASYRSMVDAVLSHCPPDVFTVSVAGDEVTHGKPHPEPYLTAARMLGADPARCIVMEDSPPGATAGNASGALVLAIPQHVPIPPAPRRVEVESLTWLTPDALRELATSSVDSVRGGLGR